MKEVDLVIIGGGSAGMAAAIKARELGILSILILEKNDYLGGILNQCIHNGFGLHEFNEELTGPEFMSRFSKEVNEKHIEYRLNSNVISISEDKIVSYSNSYEGFVLVKAKAIILTTGCYERNAGAIALAGDRPSGVYTAGQAQAYLNLYGQLVGKRVFILGSGDIGLIMARRMTLEGAKVIGVAEIMPYSAGLNRNIVQCLNDFNIPLYLSHTVRKVIGKEGHLTKIIVSKVDENFNFVEGSDMEIECDTLLLSIGLIPNVDLLSKLNLHYSKTRGPLVDNLLMSEKEGVFLAGNVLHVHDLVDYVVMEAREAALGAAKYIKGEFKRDGYIYDVVAQSGVSYVVPQKINLDNVDDVVTLKLRVAHPFKDISILVKDGDEVIKRVIKPAIVPSEMEIIKIKKELFKKNTHELSVIVEERK